MRNACHYAAPDTQVLVSGGETEGGIALAFRNEGSTIPPEKLERIFDQFFRLDSARATRTGGAGLGLAIAREIVELHGGSCWAENVPGGVRFSFQL